MQQDDASHVNPTLLPDLVKQIADAHQAACDAVGQAVEHALTAGRLLIEAKAQVDAHGEWLPWVKENCPFHERTAQRYMRLVAVWETLDDEKRSACRKSSLRAVLKAIIGADAKTKALSKDRERYLYQLKYLADTVLGTKTNAQTIRAAVAELYDRVHAERCAPTPSKVRSAQIAPAEFPQVDDDIATEYQCPNCTYEWSGQPKPGRAA